MLCRRVLLRFGLSGAVRLAGALSLAAGSLLGGLALAGVHSPWAIMVPAWIYMLGHGLHQPCGQSNAVAPFPAAAGAASALAGFVMMTVAFVAGAWVGANMDGTAWPLIAGMVFWSLCVTLTAWVLVPRASRQP
jgi:DHA1 family bicyclomycin/chloramphenicol resistance-like MFS transporter